MNSGGSDGQRQIRSGEDDHRYEQGRRRIKARSLEGKGH